MFFWGNGGALNPSFFFLPCVCMSSQRNWNLCCRALVDEENLAAETAPTLARKSRGFNFFSCWNFFGFLCS